MAPVLLLVLPFGLMGSDRTYSVASVDEIGQLHISLRDGKQEMPPKVAGQVGFDSPRVSPDHRTVGWLVDYADPTSASLLRGALVLYRSSRIAHIFRTNQSFYDWQFQDDGKKVAYSTGPLHGGAAECVLAEAGSGKVVASWRVIPDEKPPAWAEMLRR